jgi:hypothetical protein
VKMTANTMLEVSRTGPNHLRGCEKHRVWHNKQSPEAVAMLREMPLSDI